MSFGDCVLGLPKKAFILAVKAIYDLTVRIPYVSCVLCKMAKPFFWLLSDKLVNELVVVYDLDGGETPVVICENAADIIGSAFVEADEEGVFLAIAEQRFLAVIIYFGDYLC